VLRGETITLRAATQDDVPALHAILQEPEVARWWGDYRPGRIGEEIRSEDVHNFVIEVDGAPAGRRLRLSVVRSTWRR